MVIGASELRPGKTIDMEGKLYSVLDYNHNKTGRGGAVIKVKIRNLDSGAITEKTFRPGDKLEDARIETKKMQYLYKDDDRYVFMDLETFEQIEVPEDVVGDSVDFIIDDMEIDLQVYKEKIIGVSLPMSMILKVVETDPGFKGDTVNNVTKPAKLETGLTVQVPVFIKEGESIKVDTRNRNYVERA